MRTITLELLRHGPAHNQLLSPLTQYLALCESHSAVTVKVPFEHNQMLYRLRALGYAMGEEPRQFQVKDTAQMLGKLLSEIPGLTAAINRSQRENSPEALTHLRLVLSASELALLPFELALAPDGCPGVGQPLHLQSQMPLCITRETRRLAEEFVRWPDHPRILFVAASPPGYEPVPAGAHLLALRKAFEPWIRSLDTEEPSVRLKQVSRHLSVLTNASIESIERACSENSFTHIHILAHGQERQEQYDVRFGLALHDSGDVLGSADIVSGERLATALRASRHGEPGRLSSPAVVTLASCSGGNVGTVAGAGASVAHALHEAGIPLVIASQFPLSFGGSVRMAEILYEGLLWGEDPRTLLINLRRKLHTQFPSTHDWASLAAYASLPPDFEQQLASARIRRANASIDEALRAADAITRRFWKRNPQKSPTISSSNDPDTENQQLLDKASTRISDAKQRLSRLLAQYPLERARICGLLASSEKREAEIHYQRKNISRLTVEQHERAKNDALDALERARNYYLETFVTDRSSHWSIVQYLSLTLILERCNRLPVAQQELEHPKATLWFTAEMQSMEDLNRCHGCTREWALGNLVELYMLVPLVADVAVRFPGNRPTEKATETARQLVAVAGPDSFAVFSTRRQVARYLEWYNELLAQFGQPLASVMPIAEAAFAQLPEREEPKSDY